MSLRLCCIILAFVASSMAWAAPKRIAVLSLHNEGEFIAAAKAFPDALAVEYFATGTGSIAAIQNKDFSGYDLVFVEGGGNQFLYLVDTLERAKARTKVFIFNTTLVTGNLPAKDHPAVQSYWDNISPENARRLLAYLGAKFLALPLTVEPPVEFPDQAFYHPDASGHFENQAAFLAWYGKADAAHPHRLYDPAKPSLAISFNRQDYTKRNLAVIDALVREIERQGANAIPLMSKGGVVFTPHLLREGRPLVDAVIFTGLRLNYFNYDAGLAQAKALGVPLLWAPNHFRLTPAAFAQDPGGMAPAMTSSAIFAERDGIIEPIVISGRRSAAGPNDEDKEPMPEQIRWRVARALAWSALRRTPQADKRIVLTYHSEGGGKSNAGSDPDAYLDAQASIVKLLHTLQGRGYDIGTTAIPDRDTLSKLMAERAGNVGNWAPAELRRRVDAGDVVTIPEANYTAWFRSLPVVRQREVEETWGPPPGKVMVVADERGARQIVLPRLQFGKFSLMPHPDWGYLQNDAALASRGALPPHHQYIAFFLWMQREARAHAWISLFSNLSLMPGKMEGPMHDEWPSLLVGNIPNLSPTPLQANGGPGNKRRTHAVAIGFMPNVVAAGLYGDTLELAAKLARWRSEPDGALKNETAQGLRDEAARLQLGAALGLEPAKAPVADLVRELESYLRDLRREHMPAGTHIFGEAPPEDTIAEMAAAMVGPALNTELEKAGTKSAQLLPLVRRAIASDGSADAAQSETLGRIYPALIPLLAHARDYADRIRASGNEMTALLNGLDARYIPPGPIGDPVRNPDTLPSGRVTYQFDPAAMPTKEAWNTGIKLADDLVAQYRTKHGDYPQKVAFVLWSGESALNQGVGEAQILHLLGVRPVWNARGIVIDVEVVPAIELKRPRIDVLVTTSGTYRDHFRDKIDLLDKAVRLAAAQREPDNRVAAQSAKVRAAALADGEDAARAAKLADQRIYSSALGAYSPSIQFLAASGDGWTGGEKQLAELYTSRMSHGYGGGEDGKFSQAAFKANVQGVEAASISRSSNVYGTLEHPMVAAFLGGLSLAVRQQTGRTTEMFIADARSAADAKSESLPRFLSRELSTRYFNPDWIKRMMAQGYDGARYMEGLAENLTLWDATTPELVTEAHWREVRDTYIDDKLKLGLTEYMERHNPHARQAMLATLVENASRGYWKPTAEELARLTRQWAESVVKHGPGCKAEICRNQSLADTVGQSLDAAPNLTPLASNFRASLAAMKAPSSASAPAPSGAQPVTGQAIQDVTPTQSAPTHLTSGALVLCGLAALVLFAAGCLRGAFSKSS